MNFDIEKGDKRTHKLIKYPLNELFVICNNKIDILFETYQHELLCRTTYTNELTGDA